MTTHWNTEKEFTEAVRKLAKKFGWLYYHTHRAKFSAAGFPDFVFLRGHRLIFAELKMSKKEPTAIQQHWLESLRSCAKHEETLEGYGHYTLECFEVYLWYPDDWDDIIEILST